MPLMQIKKTVNDNAGDCAAQDKGSMTQNGDCIEQSSEFANVRIEIDTASVTVSRITEPKVSFLILNQQLCDAIKAYCMMVEEN